MHKSPIPVNPRRVVSLRLIVVGIMLLGFSNVEAQAQVPKFVELTAGSKAYAGKIVARGEESLWLMQRDGRLRQLKTTEITSFRKLSDKFEPYTSAQMRDLLRREYRDLEVVGTGSYLVVGPPQVVRDYAQVFEDQYRALRNYFSVRGFDLPPPEFPLIAVVFPDPTTFAKYAASDGFRVAPGLRGYYIPASNRISLFHQTPVASSQNLRLPGPHPLNQLSLQSTGRKLSDGRDWPWQIESPILISTTQDEVQGELRSGLWSDSGRLPLPWASTDGDLESTMIHEATHQVAFNIGIHSRLGSANPRWLVEGLATAFEAPGMRSTALQKVAGAKLNQSRLSRFREFTKLRRPPKSLEEFVRRGNLDGIDLLDGYAQSWALTYFLLETRPREYAQYLKLIAARPLHVECTDADRVADFRTAFGNDLVLLDAKFLRFIEQLR